MTSQVKLVEDRFDRRRRRMLRQWSELERCGCWTEGSCESGDILTQNLEGDGMNRGSGDCWTATAALLMMVSGLLLRRSAMRMIGVDP
ncbi:hypothetical protein PIB30_100381, partial [Stylosanthes scabra]|nr:hypothetical protein [Stylosanthes scabra]